MNDDWIADSTTRLIEAGILTIGDGYRAKNSELAPEGLPFARAADIDGGVHLDGADRLGFPGVERAGEKVSCPGDTVFTSKGTVGRFAFVESSAPPFVYSPQLCYWRSNRRSVLDPRFLHYWLRGPEAWSQFSQLKGQTDMADYVSLGDQRKMAITVPPLDDQLRIAGVLSAFDDKIDANRRAVKTLVALTRLSFDEWFREWEGKTRTPVDELMRRGVLVVGDGYRAKNSEMASEGTPFVRGRDVGDDVDISRADLLSTSSLKKAGDKVSAIGDSFFTAKGTVGRLGRVSARTPSFVYSPQIAYWRVLQPGLLRPDFVYMWLETREFLEQRDAVKGLTDMADYVSLTDQRTMTISIPPIRAQNEILALVTPCLDLIAAVRAETRTLAALLDTLTPKLVGGQVRVPESYDPHDGLGAVITEGGESDALIAATGD
jgi:type I restriction enzyme S subunit